MRFIPNKNPPHRETPWLSVAQRKLLLATALLEIPGFVLDERELKREGKSYTIDTLISLKKDFPQQHLCLILGMDAMAGLRSWHQWQKILKNCHIVVTQRPGYAWKDNAGLKFFEAICTEAVEDLKRIPFGRILIQSVSPVDISSSEIRQKMKNGQDVSQFLPAAVHLQLMKMDLGKL